MMKFSSKFENGVIECIFPVKTVSEANNSDHWTKKSQRRKEQKKLVYFMLERYKTHLPIPCTVHLTRYARKSLDKHDNLPMSLKGIVDAICEVITGDFRPGRADDTDQITIIYEQETCNENGLKVVISPRM